jgi:ribonuclease HI
MNLKGMNKKKYLWKQSTIGDFFKMDSNIEMAPESTLIVTRPPKTAALREKTIMDYFQREIQKKKKNIEVEIPIADSLSTAATTAATAAATATVTIPTIFVSTPESVTEAIINPILLEESGNKREWYLLQFDGGSRGNPGIAGSGSAIFCGNNTNNCIWTSADYHGIKTNNYSEYQGMIVGLRKAIELRIENLVVQGDSLLVIQQMNGKYKCKNANLIPLYEEAKQLKAQIRNIRFEHIPRNKNSIADELSNVAMDRRS